MIKATISMIIAAVYVVVSFSQPLIPSYIEDKFDMGTMMSGQNFYGVSTSPTIGGAITFGLMFLISFLVLTLIYWMVKDKK